MDCRLCLDCIAFCLALRLWTKRKGSEEASESAGEERNGEEARRRLLAHRVDVLRRGCFRSFLVALARSARGLGDESSQRKKKASSELFFSFLFFHSRTDSAATGRSLPPREPPARSEAIAAWQPALLQPRGKRPRGRRRRPRTTAPATALMGAGNHRCCRCCMRFPWPLPRSDRPPHPRPGGE